MCWNWCQHMYLSIFKVTGIDSSMWMAINPLWRVWWHSPNCDADQEFTWNCVSLISSYWVHRHVYIIFFSSENVLRGLSKVIIHVICMQVVSGEPIEIHWNHRFCWYMRSAEIYGQIGVNVLVQEYTFLLFFLDPILVTCLNETKRVN